MKKIFSHGLLVLILFFYSCSTDFEGFSSLDSGLKYKIIESNPGLPRAQIGDVLVLDMIYKNDKGEVVFSSHELGRAYLRELKEPAHPGGSIEEALAMMNLGDSAIFKINAADFYIYSENFKTIPGYLKENEIYTFYIRFNKIEDRESSRRRLIEQYHKDEETEMELLRSYLKRANITVEPQPSGFYFIEQRKGSGELIKTGDLVEIFYTGKLVDGRVFDTNYGRRPLQFRVGFGQVIPGLDHGIRLMREGGQGKMIIPSSLAYGQRGSGDILPFSTLIFEVEVEKVY